MPLHLTVGPMKSGKSLELIKIFSPLVHSDLKWVVLQPNLHDREDRVSSRAGASIKTTKVDGIDVDWRHTDRRHRCPDGTWADKCAMPCRSL